MRDLDWTQFDVLVVDDERDNLDAFRFTFRKSFRLHYAIGGDEALAQLANFEPAVIVADQRMPKMSGVELLGEVKRRHPDCYAILLTAYADLDVLVAAVNSGVVDRYIQKPWDSREFSLVLRQAISSYVTLSENRRLRDQLQQYAGYLEHQQRDPIDFGQIVGGGLATQGVLERVGEVAPTSTPVLLEGEVGLEKEVVARAIHVGSSREERPYVAVTAAAFPGEALERELFGWCVGAFDGALRDRAGRFELADGGTLWLNEPTELTPALQGRLLRVLSDGGSERVGDPRPRAVDVRFILSLSPSLRDSPLGATLLPELAARLAVFPIRLTPLRERREDIGPLAEHFLRTYAQRNARAATSISAKALAKLEAYDWPGNVRELANVVERSAILARGDLIEPRHLMFEDEGVGAPVVVERRGDGLTLGGRLDAIERGELIGALKKHNGNKAEVARALGIHRTTLYYRLKKLGIDA